ncbi:MAG: M20/M25/M40 family metallo-hydrolase, partial [Phycisphaerales bacterium]|nr:M20/M25/M40 family metallo-hydrolase [Phycisphaerales bacterium]
MRLIPNRPLVSTTLLAAAGMSLSIAGCESTGQARAHNHTHEKYAVVDGKKVEVPDIDMGEDRVISEIIAEGKHNSEVMDILRVYTIEYGPRLTGSTNLELSQKWARNKLADWGLSNARLQEYDTIATRFDRGPSTGKVILAPDSADKERTELRSMQFSTLSWSPGTDGPVSGPVAYLPTTMSEYESMRGSFQGAWVMITPDYKNDGGIRSIGYQMRDRFDERHNIRTGKTEIKESAPQVVSSENQWTGTFEYNTSKIPTTLTLDQSDGSISGHMAIEGFAEGPISEASRSGDTLSFKWTHSMGTSNISLDIQGDTAIGQSSATSGKVYPIELTKGASSTTQGTEEHAEQDRISALAAVLAENPAGFVSSSKDERVWTTSANNWAEREASDYPQDPEVNIRQSDFDFITARLKEGHNIQVEFDLDHQLTAGPIPTYNVLAEIPGSELPDEYVIISAHIDSWDGPGSMGAVDNATGSAVVTEAARILMEVGAQPKRTVLIALWGGEEQGLLGSKGFVRSLNDEQLAKISAVFVDDGGTNYQGGIPAADFMVDYLAAASSDTNGIFFSKTDYDEAMHDDNPDNDERAGYLDVNIRPTGSKIQTHSGSDHAPFNRKGVPGFFWDETGRANYRHAWHTQNDRFDQAIEEYLIQSATNMAIVAYNLANAPELLPRDGRIFTDEADAKFHENLEPIGSAHNH